MPSTQKKFNTKWFDRFVSWAQHLYWSDLNRQRFDQCTELVDIDQPAESSKWWASMSHWYASLWVVAEGWRPLKVKDQEIDCLILEWPQHCQLLKKFRHSVYHCRPNLFDKSAIGFVHPRNVKTTTIWAAALHEEFQRFYWEWPEKIMVTEEQVRELRNHLFQIIGWTPTDIMPARKRDFKEMCADTEKMLADANDYSSPQALELLDAISKAKAIFKQSPDKIYLPELMKLRGKTNPKDS